MTHALLTQIMLTEFEEHTRINNGILTSEYTVWKVLHGYLTKKYTKYSTKAIIFGQTE